MSENAEGVRRPTVVLVHGAFADSSSWNAVVQLLQGDGLSVHAVSNPLRGIAIDSAYVSSAVSQIDGPVLLVGHSYGGAVITNASPQADNVVGLVYVAAFAPDEGETLGDIETDSKDSVLNSAIVPRQYPGGDEKQIQSEFCIDPANFHAAFAADLPERQAAVMAATQRPVSALAFSERNGQPGWRTLPCWAVIATGDKAAGTDAVRSMAARAGAISTEVQGSHLIMISQPKTVVGVIHEALGALST